MNTIKILPTKEQLEEVIKRDENGVLIPDSFYSKQAKELSKGYRNSIGELLNEQDGIRLYEHSLLNTLNSEDTFHSTKNGIKSFNERITTVKEYYERYPEQTQLSVYLHEIKNHPMYVQRYENGEYIHL